MPNEFWEHEFKELAWRARRAIIRLIQAEIKPKRAFFVVRRGTATLKGAVKMPLLFDVEVTTEEIFTQPIEILTAAGKPATVDGLVAWTPDVTVPGSSFVVAADGLSITLTSPDALDDAGVNSVTFTLDADADLGAGVEDLQTQGRFTFVHPKAKSFKAGTGTATLKP